jgi:hypothetical protein
MSVTARAVDVALTPEFLSRIATTGSRYDNLTRLLALAILELRHENAKLARQLAERPTKG